MQVIETLIREAKARQIERTNEYRAEQEQRAVQAGEVLRNQFIAAFGADMLTTLDAYVNSPVDDIARITFRYQDRNYSLRQRYNDGVRDWVLTWLASRSDNDDRHLLFATISESRHDDQATIDAFVLALADLADEVDVPRWATKPIPAPKAPSTEDRLISALVEMMRGIAADSHIE